MSSPQIDVHEAGPPFPRKAPLVTATNVSRGWQVGATVAATFDVTMNDPIFATLYQRDVLRLGNMVVIRSDGLPTWVGFIDRVEWSLGSGVIKLTAKEPASIFKERHTSKEFVVTQESTARVFWRLISEANMGNATGIIISKTTAPGPSVTLDLSSSTVYDALNELCEAAGMEWWIDPVIGASGVTLTARLRSKRGQDKSLTVKLSDGGGLLSATYAHDAQLLASSVTIVGGGSGFALRPAARVEVVSGAAQAHERTSLSYEDTQVIPASTERVAGISPWLTPATSRDLLSIQPTLTDQATVAGQAVSTFDRGYRGPEELDAEVEIGRLANVLIGDVVTIEAESLGPDGISKPFRIMEFTPDGADSKARVSLVASEN